MRHCVSKSDLAYQPPDRSQRDRNQQHQNQRYPRHQQCWQEAASNDYQQQPGFGRRCQRNNAYAQQFTDAESQPANEVKAKQTEAKRTRYGNKKQYFLFIFPSPAFFPFVFLLTLLVQETLLMCSFTPGDSGHAHSKPRDEYKRNIYFPTRENAHFTGGCPCPSLVLQRGAFLSLLTSSFPTPIALERFRNHGNGDIF